MADAVGKRAKAFRFAALACAATGFVFSLKASFGPLDPTGLTLAGMFITIGMGLLAVSHIPPRRAPADPAPVGPMDEVAGLLDALRAAGVPVTVAGPAPDEAVRELEAVFGRELPPSYRDFLARFGALTLGSWHISGVIGGRIDGGAGRVWHDTQSARAMWRLPPELLVVEAGCDEPGCIDFARNSPGGECPVARFHPRAGVAPVSDPSFAVWLVYQLRATLADQL